MQFHKEEGKSRYLAKNSLHTNFTVETFWHQGFLAEYIKRLTDEKNYKYYNVIQLKEMFHKAIEDGTLTQDELKDKGGDWYKESKNSP